MRRLNPKRRHWRSLLYVVTAGAVGCGIATVFFVAAASRALPGFQKVNEELPPGVKAAIREIRNYRRPEEATYLTYPEWYLVFNPQEYAEHLRQHPPSEFPYGRSIAQFWTGYANMAGITHRNYRFNAGNHLMVVVIGTSSTVEWIIKGTYENTIGRVSEWFSGGAQTAEDVLAAEVAREYGEFIPTQPWFDFPFGQKFKALWSTTDIFGPHFIHKCERKFFLSLEYGVKFLYAGAIRLASHSVYGTADTEIYASVRTHSEQALNIRGVNKIRAIGEGSWVVTLPHYQGFTDTAPLLARQGVDFIEIAGNDELLVSIISRPGQTVNLSGAQPLFTMPLLSDATSQRIAVQVPVKRLGDFLREIEAHGMKLEHLFDY